MSLCCSLLVVWKVEGISMIIFHKYSVILRKTWTYNPWLLRMYSKPSRRFWVWMLNTKVMMILVNFIHMVRMGYYNFIIFIIILSKDIFLMIVMSLHAVVFEEFIGILLDEFNISMIMINEWVAMFIFISILIHTVTIIVIVSTVRNCDFHLKAVLI